MELDEKKQHSILSASSAHRWLKCTPSARASLEEEAECSVYAQEGIAAHKLAEIKLSYRFGKTSVSEYQERFEAFKNDTICSQYYNKEFEEYVDEFVEYVVQQTEGLQNYHIFFEFQVDFSHIVPQGFGTADVVIITNDWIQVIDLKFGQGVPVSAQDNPQLRLYGLGVINLFPLATTVKLTIHQPRLLSCDTEIISKENLIDWAVNYVKPRAELAAKGEGKYSASEEACRWCKLRGKCKVRADNQLAIAQQEFMEPENGPPVPNTLTVEQISKILEIGPLFNEWYKDVVSYAIGQLSQGVKIPGFKLVEGRSNRIITDENKVAEILKGVGLTDEDLYKPRQMKGISALEKIVGPKLFGQLCKEYLIKPPGKITLASETDRRPEVSTLALAQSDFALPVEETE